MVIGVILPGKEAAEKERPLHVVSMLERETNTTLNSAVTRYTYISEAQLS